jgi:hypothetical protein
VFWIRCWASPVWCSICTCFSYRASSRLTSAWVQVQHLYPPLHLLRHPLPLRLSVLLQNAQSQQRALPVRTGRRVRGLPCARGGTREVDGRGSTAAGERGGEDGVRCSAIMASCQLAKQYSIETPTFNPENRLRSNSHRPSLKPPPMEPPTLRRTSLKQLRKPRTSSQLRSATPLRAYTSPPPPKHPRSVLRLLRNRRLPPPSPTHKANTSRRPQRLIWRGIVSPRMLGRRGRRRMPRLRLNED